MRILFTTQPGLGHFHPLVPLARVAQKNGHNVLFACAAAFCEVVEAAGFDCLPAGLDWLESAAERAFPQLSQQPSGATASAYWLAEIFAGATAAPMARDLLAHVARWQPDVIVRDPLDLGACLAAERLGLPHATAGASVFASPREWRALLGRQLDALWQAHGMPAGAAVPALYRYLDLAAVPPSFVAGDPVPPVTHFLRPEPFDGGQELPPALESWLGRRPIVYASLGTVFNRAPGLLRQIVAALRDEPLRLVLATGPGYDAGELGELPESVYTAPYLPQSLLLPHCDLVITHGGLNTVVAALCYGLPMVALPLGADQPANAQRAADLGAARVLDPARCTPASLRAAVREVLGKPGYRAAAGRVRREIAALPGAERGVELLGQLARERKPIVRRTGWRQWLRALRSVC